MKATKGVLRPFGVKTHQIMGILLVPILVILISSSSPKVTADPAPDQAWLRFCSDGDTFRANPFECTNGYWLKKRTTIQCVCAHGIWVLSNGYCDPNYAVIVGLHGTCFSFDAQVTWIRHIGNPDVPFAPYYFLSSNTFEKVHTLRRDTFNPELKDSGGIIGTINAQASIDSKQEFDCLLPNALNLTEKEGPPAGGNDLLPGPQLIPPAPFSFSPLKSRSALWSYQIRDYCSKNSNQYAFAVGIQMNQFFSNGIAKYSYEVDHTCNNTCLAANEWDVEVELKKRLNKSEITGQNLEYDYPFSSESDNMVFKSQEKNCTEPDPQWNALSNGTMIALNEQTKRMIRNQISFSLLGIPTPVINLTEYKLFQKSRKIFQKVCPTEEVPIPLLDGLLRMFRTALNESLIAYPYRRMGDTAEYERITTALDKCLKAPLDDPMEFQYKNDTCPKEFTSIIMKFNKRAGRADLEPRNVSSYLPCALSFNRTKYDMPIEAAWKVVMFTSYFCARHFNDTAVDHSRYFYKMQSLFNRQLIHRWHNPWSSLQGIEYIFQMFDLEKFSLGMDRCVGAVRSISQYRKWIRRPEYIQFCSNVAESTQSKAGARSKSGGGYFRNDTDPIWNGAAYCIKEWSDPLVLVNDYKSEAKKICTRNDGDELFFDKFLKNA